MPPYLLKLGEWLMQDSTYESLITPAGQSFPEIKYPMLRQRSVCCVSENHIDRVSRDLVPAGTPDAPANISPTDFVAFTADTFTVPARYAENPEVVRDTEQKKLLDSICSTILDSSTRKAIKALKTGSAALVELARQRDDALVTSSANSASTACTMQPDVAYSVGYLCRAMSRPTELTMLAAERVLMYLYLPQPRSRTSVRRLSSSSSWPIRLRLGGQALHFWFRVHS